MSKTPLAIIGTVGLSRLWEKGFTIAPRLSDPTNLTHADIPAGRAYQWFHMENDAFYYTNGWAPVAHSRHPGRFAPWGADGHIQWNGLGLFEKPKFEVDAEHAANHAKAHQNAADCLDQMRSIVTDAGYELIGADAVVSPQTMTIEPMSEIPTDLVPHIHALLHERDKIVDREKGTLDMAETPIAVAFRKAVEENPDIGKWPLLRSLAMPEAIKIIRERLKNPESTDAT